MAEIFGIVTGAVSVAALFNNCVDTFEYIQLGRHFGQDYERCQLKLDLAKTRLGRWGEVVGVNRDERFTSASQTDGAVKVALGILEDMDICFKAAEEKSKRYANRAGEEERMICDNNNMKPVFQRLHNHCRDIGRRRKNSIGILKKSAWALYDGKSLESIINQVLSWIDELEKLFPNEKTTYQKVVEIEIEEVNDELGLKTLKDAARDIDPDLEQALERKVASIEGNNSVKNITLEDGARSHIGNSFSAAVLQHEILVNDRTNNSVDTISAKNESRIQVGTVYGGKGIWD
ncbi:hypothetical protein ACSS6W_010312 [Trichoderma asperelloides]|uniref:Heterokaryon incompatibility protein s n=1 Tax=Trichoderma asperellum TaxID=101201 RepID=A0A6V8QZZ6_TRIAP|nr:prion-inhibition and propagation-domain-containing protein [Trichoderma asperelloides]GFP57396.1 heterokaryon incompatibility protein s [Trichoderma asperellum]